MYMCDNPESVKEFLQYRLAFIGEIEVPKQVQAQNPEIRDKLGKWSQQVEYMKIPNGTEPGI